MRNLIYSFALILVTAASGICQIAEKYDWENSRKQYTLTPEEAALPELTLKLRVQEDHVLEGDQLFTYMTFHEIVRVNTTSAIERNNRIYINVPNTIDLTTLKARVITSANKIVTFSRENLKELKDEESGAAYRIFAIEGAETGSEIEYLYTRKVPGRSFTTNYLQSEIPAKEVSFQVSSPRHLIYDNKAYQTSLAFKSDTLNNRNYYVLNLGAVPGLPKEDFANYDYNRIRVESKLAYNTARSRARMNTWSDAARRFHEILWTTEKGDDKLVSKFVKTLQDNPSQSLEDRIVNIESRVKGSITLNKESNDDQLEKLSYILQYKAASGEGITKLFIQIFKELNIPVQLVVTCSRENVQFDAAFDTWAFLDEYILYFPGNNQFLAPYNDDLRYPLIPDEFQAQKGLFIEATSVAGIETGLGKVRDIPELPYTQYTDNLTIDVKFTSDLTKNEVHIVRDFTGSDGSGIARIFGMIDGTQKSKLYESILGQTIPDAQMKKASGKPLTPTKFQFDLEIESEHLLEKAGNRVLFKVGELIGRQSELYSEEKRRTPVDNTHNRGYDRIIRIQIPNGYQVRNPDDLKMDVQYKDGSEVPYLFISKYEIKGSVLEITINEYYKRIHAPLERYEDFRKVVNAAADFNKVTLVLEKK